MRAFINYFKKYPYALALLLIMIVWITINAIEADKYTKLLQNEGKYTLGKIKGTKGASTGRYVTVEFEYNDRIFETEIRNSTIPHSWIEERIFIKFLPSKPTEIETYEKIDVPDSILELVTSRVWDTLPVRN